MNVLKQPSNNYQKAWLVAVLEQGPPITPATKLVASFLREIWWNDVGTPDEPTDNTIHASYEQIQRATHLSNGAISKAINQLEDAGFLHQTSRSKKQGTANRYYPVRYDLAIESIADDYLSTKWSGVEGHQTYYLSTSAPYLSTLETDLSTEWSVNSKEIVGNSFTEDTKEDEGVVPLDTQTSTSLDETSARFEHKEMPKYTGQEWMEKAQERQARINAEFEGVA